MNYISQLNGFWRWRQVNIISPKSMLLYFAILNFANLSRWQDSFPIPTEQLSAITGLGKNELSNCRKELAEHKLILYERGYRGQPAHYKLNLLYSDDKKNTPVFGTNSEQGMSISPVFGNSSGNSTVFGTNCKNDLEISPVFGINSENSTGNTPVFGTSSEYVVTTLNKDIYKLNNLLNKYIYINNIYNNPENLVDSDKSTGSKAVGHACSYNDFPLTAGGPGDEAKGSTTDGPAGSVKRCVDFFTSAIHPFFSVTEADMINTLIYEYGEKAFIGAVKYAKQNNVRHTSTWKWLQTVLQNGDWVKGYGQVTEKEKVMSITITPDEIFSR